jgi:hypothetical protein
VRPTKSKTPSQGSVFTNVFEEKETIPSILEEMCLLIDEAGVCLPLKDDDRGTPVSGTVEAEPDEVDSFAMAARY